MADARRKWCKGPCGRHVSECGPISWRGKCVDCAQLLVTANLIDLKTHSGAYFLAYRRACVAAFGGVLLDDVREQP